MRRAGGIGKFSDGFQLTPDFRLNRFPRRRYAYVAMLEADELQFFDDIVQFVFIVKKSRDLEWQLAKTGCCVHLGPNLR
jgi:hypothetical protein